MGDEFVFDWTDKLGFDRNPFHTDIPEGIEATYAGYKEERKELNVFVLEQEQYGSITGGSGAGKTMTLRWMERHAGQEAAVSYMDAAALETERDLIEQLVAPVVTVVDMVTRKHTKLRLKQVGRFLYRRLDDPLLLLVDNVGDLPERYHSLFTYFFDKDLPVQVIAAGTSRPGITDDALEMRLDGVQDDDLKALLRHRVAFYGREGIFPFEEGMLEPLIDAAGGNPQQFLEHCRKKAIKLALDDEYMEDKDRGSSGWISVQWGSEDQTLDEHDLHVPEPDMAEQGTAETGGATSDGESAEKSEKEKTEEMLSQLSREFDQ